MINISKIRQPVRNTSPSNSSIGWSRTSSRDAVHIAEKVGIKIASTKLSHEERRPSHLLKVLFGLDVADHSRNVTDPAGRMKGAEWMTSRMKLMSISRTPSRKMNCVVSFDVKKLRLSLLREYFRDK